MGELINGRTPEEIKRVLCGCGVQCKDCPYVDYQEDCAGMIECDALALIERLEAERDAALAKVPRRISAEESLPEYGSTNARNLLLEKHNS